MKKVLGKKFWLALTIFSLTGQVAWVVENMYFNVFIYKIFNATAANISLMVAASSVTAAITALIIGAWSDKVGKRKAFICGGYLLWGISILAFCLLRMDWLEGITGSVAAAASLGVTLVILMDCVMTFFGSSANDACFNAWLTESGDESNRGAIEGINAMMPLIATLVVFGGFMSLDLEKESSWTTIFLIIGISVLIIGILGIFLIDERSIVREENHSFINNLTYSFRLRVMKENKMLYMVIAAFAVFGISIQIFMPYLILYYEKGLGMSNYVLILAPAIILAMLITVGFGKIYDKVGFQKSVYPAVIILGGGYVVLAIASNTVPVFIGSVLMMGGYLSGMAVFGAKIRDTTPSDKAGLFQGVRILGQVLIPGIIGPAIGAFVLSSAEMITNSDGTTSFIPNSMIFVGALYVVAVLLYVLSFVFYIVKKEHRTLSTDFGRDGEKIPFPEYPRPQLRRDSFYNLNGAWKEAKGFWNEAKSIFDDTQADWQGDIIVPFPLQSELSGYKEKVGDCITYSRTFELPADFVKDKLLLHFGAVDQITEVFVNGIKVGYHEGGYLPFVVDITNSYKAGENKLLVKATDQLLKEYPHGKQCLERGGMWYTPISGIWQTVWIESVPKDYVEDIRIKPDMTGIDLEVSTNATEYQVIIKTDKGEVNKAFTDKKVRIDLEEEGFAPQLWTAENPHLYEMTIIADDDKVESYFGLRTVDIREINGKNKICLNGNPIFLHAVLDQGYYSDGIYLPASEDGYKFDIEKMKEMGFNTLRKHIKVEPECFYYMCDKMGMLVMQDMVNSGGYSFIRDTAIPTFGYIKQKDNRPFIGKKQREIFIQHSKDTINHLYNHPCIVYYTIFNEGWGQFDSDKLYDIIVAEDHSRVIDATSGWFQNNKSDVESFHCYFHEMEFKEASRPQILSEFGGYSYVIKEHSYSLHNQYGYAFFKTPTELTDKIIESYEATVIKGIDKGVCGSVYTQVSDVEDEVNGFYTYDRKVCKVEVEKIQDLSKRLMEAFDATE